MSETLTYRASRLAGGAYHTSAREAIEEFSQQLDEAIGGWHDRTQRTLLRAGLDKQKTKYLKRIEKS